MPVDALAREVRRFADSMLDDAAIERAGRVPDEVIAGLRDLGVFGMTIPEEYGGLGFSLATACRLVAELARRDRSVATLVGLHAGLGTYAVVHHGSDAVRDEWLPRLARGEAIGAFAATESSAGSDIAAVRTRAVRDGKDVVVTGEKSYVTNARHAGCFTVLARWGERSHALVLVPRDAPGVSVGAEERKLGIKASSTATVSLDHVRVPDTHILGGAGAGLERAHEALARGRTVMASGCVGTARAALDRTIEHVTARRQFRRPVSHFSAVRLRVAELAATVVAMEALVSETANDLDDQGSLATKVFASEGAFDVCDSAIQLHGALGVMEDEGVCRLLRDCRVTRIFEGANDVLLVRLGMAMITTRARLPRMVGRGHHAGAATAQCDVLAERLEAAVDGARERYGARVVEQQTLLQGLARAEVARRAALACLRWADRRDEDLALFAADHFAGQGIALLESLPRREATEALAHAVSEHAYAGHTVSNERVA